MGDKQGYKAYIDDISNYQPDKENANRHTLRGRSLVHKGMEKRGYARPAFAAKDGTVLGGNLSTLDVAVDIGLGEGKVLVVETSGNLPIIHKRMDVEPGTEEARLLALEDNRTAEISLDWNPAVVIDFLGQGLEIGDLWDANELSVMLEGAADSLLPTDPANDPNAEWAGMPEFEQKDLTGVQQIHVHFKTRGDVDTFAKLIGQKLTEYTRSIWYPQAEKIDMKSEVYQSES